MYYEAQAKPSTKRVRPPMAKHTPRFIRGHSKATKREYFGWEPVLYDDESGHASSLSRKKVRKPRTVRPCDSEETSVKGPLSASAQEGTSSSAPAPITNDWSPAEGSEQEWKPSLNDSSFDSYPVSDAPSVNDRNKEDYPKFSSWMNARTYVMTQPACTSGTGSREAR